MQLPVPINCTTAAGSKGTVKKEPGVLLGPSPHLPRATLRSPCHHQDLAKEHASGGGKAALRGHPGGDPWNSLIPRAAGGKQSREEQRYLI